MRTVTVNVTQEDANGSEGSHCRRCPIAKAVSRALGTSVRVFTDPHGAMAQLDDGLYIELPAEAVAFIRAFDAGRAVRPIAFPLHVPNATEVSHA